MPKAQGMEFIQETVVLSELADRLGEFSLDGWELVTVLGVHANAFELGDGAHCLVVLKRPKKK